MQRFIPKPQPKAQCITGKRLLIMFGAYHKKEAKWVADKYPWLLDWDPGCPGEEEQPGAGEVQLGRPAEWAEQQREGQEPQQQRLAS